MKIINTPEINQSIKEKWKKYIMNNERIPEQDPDIRDFILQSWKRSKAHNINPLEVKNKQLSSGELKKVLERNKRLINAAHSYMQHLYAFIKGTNFVLALTDADGYVIDLIGDDTMIQTKTKKSGLSIGCCRSEEYAGTNGIGTCLIVGRPVQIWAYEHYIKPHHGYVCSAAPIRNSNNVIIGCLDVVGPLGLPHNHTLAMVSASADAIEKELKMAEAFDRLSIVNTQMSTVIQTIDNGIIMFDNMGMISQYNKRACQILHLPEGRLEKENIRSIINFEKSTLNPFEEKRNILNQEALLMNCNGEKIQLSLSLSLILNDLGQQQGTILIINELNKTYSLVNRISGFTATYNFNSIMGESPEIMKAKKMGLAASQSNSNVLILGESGTGKELMAQAIHNASSRADGPFIAINCGSLPKGLIESELFGYARGAFTGAKKEGHPGKFELANGGTIFLDEIGDMPIELQTSLLRVIQTREIVRIGGSQVKEIDVRIMAATNVDLMESVKKNEFREDLYYRINVLPIIIPPLRQRKSDIRLLTKHFIESTSNILKKNVTGIDDEAMQALISHDWPGNVRELENTIERAVNLADSPIITVHELPATITNNDSLSEQQYSTEQISASKTASSANNMLSKSHKLIVEALAAERGNVSKAAERLGMPRRTLYRRIDKFNINIDEFRLL